MSKRMCGVCGRREEVTIGVTMRCDKKVFKVKMTPIYELISTTGEKTTTELCGLCQVSFYKSLAEGINAAIKKEQNETKGKEMRTK